MLNSSTSEDIINNSTIDSKTKIINKEKLAISMCIYNFIKRIFDIIGGLIGIIILIPSIVFVAMLRRKYNEKGPIFYTQLRIGKNGKEFKLYKFRTMCMDADEKLKEYLEKNPDANEEYQKYKKLKSDPRITQAGNFLRKTSLDEFPQFINVLLGNMSLVGPRPYLPREKEDMGEFYKEIIKCKPGITGWWQINGRSNTTFEERLEKDEYYVKNRNILLDIKIVGKTILQIILKSGAI